MTTTELNPLTNDEAALLYTVQMYGSSAYPIRKRQSKWIIDSWRDWPGFPMVYRTKRAAVEQFEAWIKLALERWVEMKASNPNAMLTGVGIKAS